MSAAAKIDPVTNLDKLMCAKREFKLRSRVYPRWVTAGKISNHDAQQQLKVMAAIVDDYRAAVEREKAKERLL